MTTSKHNYATEIRLICYVAGLYTAFVYWGYLQEKITSTDYLIDDGTGTTKLKWQFPFSLNLFMAFSTFVVASVGEIFSPSKTSIPLWVYAKPAITCAIGSPIGYMALEYISFPLVVLVKSSKPVPVMIVGIIFYNKSYPWYKYLSVLLLCSGIALFSFAKTSSSSSSSSPQKDEINLWTQCFGIILVGLNVFLDGYTNNEQDHIFEKHTSSSLQMMKYVNFWQFWYLLVFLLFGYFLFHQESEFAHSSHLFLSSSQLQNDIFMFCLSASIGQLFIFAVMKEFGSLMWVTLSITRKLFTIIVSIVMFNHQISSLQWVGVAAVFFGMSVEVMMNYMKTNLTPTPSAAAAPRSSPKTSSSSSASSSLDRQSKKIN
jgi:solute carrier family 35 (UDP-galactose transporter), member B1